MWSGPLHDKDFVSKTLEHVENNEDSYGTVARMKGMLTVAKEVNDKPCAYMTAVYCFVRLIQIALGIEHAILFHTFEDSGPLPLRLPIA